MISLVHGNNGAVLAAVLVAGMACQCVGAPEGATTSDKGDAMLMSLFPDSGAPTFFEKPSELVLKKDFASWERDKKWHPEIDERDVHHATLQHRSVTERCWELGIGKGGQIYSMYSSFGEAMAPSKPDSQWNDEVWQFTTIYEPLLGRDLPKSLDDGSQMMFANAYVHQSGIYTKEKGSKPFYSPILAEHFDEKARAYSILSWGQIPSPSINRSGVLVYARYRDLGAGVIEVTYVVFNFEDEPMTNLSPWGGVRTSVFPEHVISNPDGSYRYFTPWCYSYDKFEGCRINFEDTGGWAAVTANAADPHSYAIGLVFGKQLDKKGEHRGKPRYDCGDSRHGTRDYTVQATVINIKDKPGTPHMLRMYFAIGTLDQVAATCNRLADHADYEPLVLTDANAPLVPLYSKQIGESVVLTRTGPGDAACQVYAWPVSGSRPLFLMKNNKTGRHFVTTDPYAQCAREPFGNPFKPGHESYAKYQGRTIYRPYLKQTDWVELLGFVMPKDKADMKAVTYTTLSDVRAVEQSFDPGAKLGADSLLVRGR